MSQALNCNYARTAIRELCQKERGSVNRLSQEVIVKAVEKYNRHFQEPSMHLPLTVANKRIRPLLALFNKKWYPQSQKQIFLDTFSLNSWNQLSSEEKK